MITLIEVRTLQGTLLSLPLDDSLTGPSVEDIGGLGPVKATIVSSGFATMDGTEYQSAHREERNITMKLGLNPDYFLGSVHEARSSIYDFFMPKSLVYLRFYDSTGLTVDIQGRVETCEPSIFSDDPAIDISVICFNPDFVDVNTVELSGSTVTDTTDTIVDYKGTVETGFLFTLNADRALSGFTIYNRPPDNALRTLNFEADLAAGDVLEISTLAGAKSIMVTRSGVRSSLLYGMPAQSDWIELFRGSNALRVHAEGNPVPYTITYTPRYGGL